MTVAAVLGLIVGAAVVVLPLSSGSDLTEDILGIAAIMIAGAFLTITGRSRVLLIVGMSLLTAVLTVQGVIGFLLSKMTPEPVGAGEVILPLGLLIVTPLVIIVLLSQAPAAEYFTTQRAHRARRGR